MPVPHGGRYLACVFQKRWRLGRSRRSYFPRPNHFMSEIPRPTTAWRTAFYYGANTMVLITGLIVAFPCLIYWVWRQECALRKRLDQQWEQLPSVNMYLNRLKRDGKVGISCLLCGSKSVRQLGWAAKNDPRRLHSCNHCNTTLYRSSRI